MHALHVLPGCSGSSCFAVACSGVVANIMLQCLLTLRNDDVLKRGFAQQFLPTASIRGHRARLAWPQRKPEGLKLGTE